jgi:plasmid maintenance system antidote protein VapI
MTEQELLAPIHPGEILLEELLKLMENRTHNSLRNSLTVKPAS